MGTLSEESHDVMNLVSIGEMWDTSVECLDVVDGSVDVCHVLHVLHWLSYHARGRLHLSRQDSGAQNRNWEWGAVEKVVVSHHLR